MTTPDTAITAPAMERSLRAALTPTALQVIDESHLHAATPVPMAPVLAPIFGCGLPHLCWPACRACASTALCMMRCKNLLTAAPMRLR